MNCINLVVAMNPCPCGFYPDRNRCRCTQPQIRNYMKKISGPILDRIDLCVELQQVDLVGLKKEKVPESSDVIRERVMRARERQAERFRGTAYRFNADIDAANIDRYCALGREEQAFLEQIYHSLQLSARAYHRILKVARTIADLAGEERLLVEHLLEASFYRPQADYWI
ncbi:MAG: ATP-binding protein [Ruminococcus flavefaciens]|nr:ATP-binding protein [Ruminococcus flavefaciens]